MKFIRLPMGCLSSRSTIAPEDRLESNTTNQKNTVNNNIVRNHLNNNNNNNSRSTTVSVQQNGGAGLNNKISSNNIAPETRIKNIMMKNNAENNNNSSSSSVKPDNNNNNITRNSIGSDIQSPDNDLMSLIIDAQNKENNGEEEEEGATGDGVVTGKELALINQQNSVDLIEREGEVVEGDDNGLVEKHDGNSLSSEEEANLDLWKQYIVLDYEITQSENRDTLRVYHEKIELLEQLERELDMISTEAEEVATREDDSQLQLPAGLNNSINGDGDGTTSPAAGNDQAAPIGTNNIGGGGGGESNSMLSGITGSMSQKSWINNNNNGNSNNQNSRQMMMIKKISSNNTNSNNTSAIVKSNSGRFNKNTTSSYSTVEDVFNRKIILEKERDKLKKEVEMVIVECDKLQQRYKKRDEILDKLFDGKAGNSLENHLEQQLNWLMEQKHYVDQVFYAWKRAETLTIQTCEQFARALELLKHFSKNQEPGERREEIGKDIANLLIESRQDMKQAQEYNPNVDAPFFTDNETDRFDKIIETLLSSNSISSSEYNQIQTVIQFAYKRAISIRLWLEQILQTTIARDSFELAEEYKWIAIQLRKERINLIRAKLQETKFKMLTESILNDLVRQTNNDRQRQQNEINRDSGVESDLDIEEEIYRLLEMNKSRLEQGGVGGAKQITGGLTNGVVGGESSSLDHQQLNNNNALNNRQQLDVAQNLAISASSSSDSPRNQLMRDRINKRVKGSQELLLDSATSSSAAKPLLGGGLSSIVDVVRAKSKQQQQLLQSATSTMSNNTISTPTRLRIELNEEARQSLLKQVDQIHNKHKSRIERLRDNNKAKANSIIISRMQQQQQQQQQNNPEQVE